MLYEDSITGKWLGMLKEIAPHLMRAVLVGHPKNPNLYAYFLRTAKAIAPSLGIEVLAGAVENAGDIERFVESFARVPNRWLGLSSR